MTVDPSAVWSPSPNQWTGRGGYKPRYIILHGTAGPGAGSLAWLKNPASVVSAHYLIMQSGKIYQLVDEDNSAWANGVLEAGHDSFWNENINPNLLSISIEHEKPDTNNATPLTNAQAMASMALVGRICQRWNIPAKVADASGGITGHYSIDPQSRAHCPGVYPWDALFSYINQTHGEATTMLQVGSGMGQFFTDLSHGTIAKWHCSKTNVYLVGDNLAFYRKYEGIFGIPLTNEIYLAQYPGTAIVVCERAILCFDPKRKIDSPPGAGSVYLMHVDSGTGQQLVAKPLITNLNKQISDANAKIAELEKTQDVKTLEAQIADLQKQADTYHHALQVVLQTAQPFK